MIAPFFLRRTKAEVFKKPQKKSSKDQTKNTDKDDHKYNTYFQCSCTVFVCLINTADVTDCML